MSTLISGSLVYDRIMDFPGRFRDHILPENIHILNVSFVVDRLEKSLGGTAGNIAYTLKLLGGDPLVVGALGSDAGEYLEHLKRAKISAKYIARDATHLTASAHIITDKEDNQITGFFGGVPYARTPGIGQIKEALSVAIISPAHKEVMKRHARECAARGITLMFDPGQQITALSGAELRAALRAAHIVIGNDYEMKVLEKKTGLSEKDLLRGSRILITTLGSRGSRITTAAGGRMAIKPCKPRSDIDPTGAGDAYRAGFLAGFGRGYDLLTCGQMGSVAACYAIETRGTQEHTFTKAAFRERYQKTYGSAIIV